MSRSIFTPPTSPPPGKERNLHVYDTPMPLAMPIAQMPMGSFSRVLQPQTPQHGPLSDTGRVIIMCFDGTGNKFGERNSNIVRFFRALKKDNKKKQVVYYQPGIGTYNKKAWITHTMNTLSTMVDFAIARHLDEHVKDGYTYLIQNYRPGDKICLFGFSRGAHTARVVAGMIYKVGILPRENLQQVDFAFNIYMTTGYEGYKLSREFKLTFASHVDIDFVGVWDTVSSVGIIPQTHPYTSINYSVKCFRHALALDERRTRFRPNVWSELTVEREQELDIDLPAPKEPDLAAPNGILGTRDDWEYSPPERDHADVKEVWFAGSHSDVGGGSHTTKRNHSLSFIPLRWMIKECILTKTGIQFDMEYLRDSLDFDFHELVTEMEEKDMKIEDLGQAYQGIENYAQESFEQAQERQERAKAKAETQSDSPQTHVHGFRHYIHDVIDTIFDQLLLVWFWWILEFLPMLSTYQDLQGNWIRVRMRNFGRGRYIPFYKDQILVHKTVDVRINTAGQRRYKPKARNWDTVEKSPMLKYVT